MEVFGGAEGLIGRTEEPQSELSVTPLYEGMPGYLEAIAEYRSRGFEVRGFYPVFRDPRACSCSARWTACCCASFRDEVAPPHGTVGRALFLPFLPPEACTGAGGCPRR